MKKCLSILMLLLVMILMNACGGKSQPASDGSPMTIQVGFTTSPNEDDPYNVFATKFAEIVNKETEGRITIEPKGSGQLGQEREMFEGMQLGSVDMAIMTNAYASNFVPASGLFDLPFIFKDYDTASKILDGTIGQNVLKEYEEQKVVALGWGEGGFRHLVSNGHGVKEPSDFKGMKIRCMETKAYLATYGTLSANAVPMAWAETITGIQQKTIDGLDIPISVIYSNGFPKVADYLSLTGHFYSPLIMCISKSKWDNIPAADQEILRKAAVEAGQFNRKKNREIESSLLQKMKDEGMSIIEDVDKEKFLNTLGDFYSTRKSEIGKTYVDDLMNELK